MSEPTLPPVNMSLEDLGLPPRSLNALVDGGISRVGDLLTLTRAHLLRIPNFGRRALGEVETALETLGLRLAPLPHEVSILARYAPGAPTAPAPADAPEPAKPYVVVRTFALGEFVVELNRLAGAGYRCVSAGPQGTMWWAVMELKEPPIRVGAVAPPVEVQFSVPPRRRRALTLQKDGGSVKVSVRPRRRRAPAPP
jgi:hypothetical protein